MGDSRPARQTQDGTDGAGGFLCRGAHPTLTILSLPRSAASRWPPPGPSELQGSPRSSTPRLPASSLPCGWPLHPHRPAPVAPLFRVPDYCRVTRETSRAEAEIADQRGESARQSLGIVSGCREEAWRHVLQTIEEAKELVPGSKACEFAV